MSNCCSPRGYDRMFSDRFARRMASRYRKRGLDKVATRMVELVLAKGVEGASVLEVGGGIGEIHVELLRHGAARATNLELSQAYEPRAQRLLDEAGLAGKVERRIVDIATEPEKVEPADVVVLHRVVCCYPDYAKLLGAVTDHARRLVVFSYPPRNVVSRTIIGAENLSLRLRGSEFRAFTHSPKAMLGVLAARGMNAHSAHTTPFWNVAVAERAG